VTASVHEFGRPYRDECPVCGREGCEDHLSRPSKIDALPIASASEIVDEPTPPAIVEGVAWPGALTVLPGESSAGKTFLVISIGGAIAAGRSWQERRTLQGSVVFVAYEADAIGRRLRALRDVQNIALDHIYVIRAHDTLSPRVTRDGELPSLGERSVIATLDTLRADLRAAALPPVRLIVIDTVRASLSGNEDSSEHVSAYLRAVRRIAAALPDAGVILTHHAGWQDGEQQRKRERGSSAWRGNVDATLYLEASDYDPATGRARLTLHARKVRDEELPAPLRLIRRRVELPGVTDAYGRPATTCIIEADGGTSADHDAAARQKVDQESRAFDLRTLRLIVDRPDLATSVDKIRIALGNRTALVSQSISRLVNAGLLTPPDRRGDAYRATPEGLAALHEDPRK
jgi:hypothetical protein